MEQMDTFLVNLDAVNNIEASTLILLQLIQKNQFNKILLLDYSGVGDSIIRDNLEKYNLELENAPEKTFEFIERCLEKLGSQDILLVVGVEKLLTYSNVEGIVEGEFKNFKSKYLNSEDAEWDKFFETIEDLYGKYQQQVKGIYFNLNINLKIRDIIFEIVEEMANFSVSCIEYSKQDREYEEFQRELFGKIKLHNLEEMMGIIEENKGKLDIDTYRYIRTLTYIENGAFSEAIRLLNENYDSLRNEEKLILANSYIYRGDNAFAEPILQELFQKDKYLKGLVEAIITHNLNSDNKAKEKWIKILSEIDPKNPAVLEFNASYLSRIKNYKEAAEKFRELKHVLKEETEYYELIARMNDLISSPPTENEAIHYILHDYVDTDLENEARYRLAKFLLDFKDSYYSAYSVLRDASIDLTQNRIREITELKLDILQDNIKASRALGKLKVYRKEDHITYLIKERMRVIIESTPILANSNNGYLLWKEYIDTSQNDLTWRKSSYKGLIELIEILKDIDYFNILNNSYVSLVEQTQLMEVQSNIEVDADRNYLLLLNSIKLIRRVKSGEFAFEDVFDDLDEFTKVTLKVPEILNDIDSKIWSRYYLSLLLAYRGETQTANNIAISLFEISTSLEEKKRDLSLFLGLIAWANSQYRIGRIAEGTICLISALKFHNQYELNEFYPILEEAVNLISRFISDNLELIEASDINLLVDFANKISEYNPGLKETLEVLGYIEIDNLDEKEKTIRRIVDKDTDWAIRSCNLISIFLKNDLEQKAIDYINEFGDKIINELSIRMDMRFRILYSWANLYFHHPDFDKTICYLEIALNDIEKLRDVFHKEERAGLAELYNDIYRLYVQVCGLLYSASDIGEEKKKDLKNKILKIIPKLSPMSIAEQKKYNNEKNFSEELVQAEKKLNNLKEEYKILLKKGKPTDVIVNNKAKEIESLTKHLQEIHPHYQKLNKIENINLNTLATRLFDNELFYQIIITPMSVMSIIVTNKGIDINSTIILQDRDKVEKLFEIFSLEIQQNGSDENLKLLVQEISTVIATNLINFVQKNKIDRVYFMPDFKMGFFPLLISENNGIRLIDHIKSLVNLIDYNVIFKKDSYNTSLGNVLNRIYGKPEDASLKMINEWLEQKNNPSMIKLDNSSDDISNIILKVKEEENNSLILYGHGLADPKSSGLDGSIGIEGRKQLLILDDFLDVIQEIDNFILISCRGGSPYYINPENSSSVYVHILEKFEGNIVLCKWDVPTKETIELLDKIIDTINEKNCSLDEAILLTQKKASENNNYNKWAGLEFWIN
ncbi:tetratricopeptide repeat protein [Metabacillus fastidiosus]|uniref:tetratricopeptide repeat protein n=1 Tax=Metabacillus fastidiosus TaxID=1458 RepID=UPI003D2A0679